MVGGGGRRSKDNSRYNGAATNGDITDLSPVVVKLESDMKRLKSDLQHSRNRENELRDQIVCYMSSKLYFTISYATKGLFKDTFKKIWVGSIRNY